MKRTADRKNPPQPRRGFSLIELLAVIVVIGILISLLFPAINAVRNRARVALAASELGQLDTALASVAGSGGLGIQPPSEIILTEDPGTTAWTADAQTKLRRMFELFDFTIARDINGDGDSTDVLTLTSSECLVFFLGGIPSVKVGATPQTLQGFSKNPADPLNRTGSNRVGPFFTFDAGRLIDTDGDAMLEYLDAFPNQKTPLHFASSNNGQGYSTAASIYVQSDGKTPWNKDGFQIVSPGQDTEFGFVPSAGTRSVFAPDVSFDGVRRAESDNVANFKPGSTLQ